MTSDPDWLPCEPGTLKNLNTSSLPRAAYITRRGVWVTAMTIAAGGGLFQLLPQSPGRISCQQVSEFARDYVDGILSKELAAAIDAHREHCEICHDSLTRMEAMRDQQV